VHLVGLAIEYTCHNFTLILRAYWHFWDTYSITTESKLFCNNTVHNFTSEHYASIKNHTRLRRATNIPKLFSPFQTVFSARTMTTHYPSTCPKSRKSQYAYQTHFLLRPELRTGVFTNILTLFLLLMPRRYELCTECFWWQHKLGFIAPRARAMFTCGAC
jgi:hypothetical protein